MRGVAQTNDQWRKAHSVPVRDPRDPQLDSLDTPLNSFYTTSINMSSRVSPFQAENSGEEEGRPVLPADGARSRPPVHPSPRPAVRPTARAAPTNGGQRESRSAFTSRPEDSQFASLDIQLIYFYTTNINISSSLTTFRATKSGNDNFRSVLSADRAATSLGARWGRTNHPVRRSVPMGQRFRKDG